MKQNIYKESDFKLRETLPDNMVSVPFEFTYFVYGDKKRYTAFFDGTTYTNCVRDGNTIVVCFNAPKFSVGVLNVIRKFDMPDSDFKDGQFNMQGKFELDIRITGNAADLPIGEISTEVPPVWSKGADGDSAYQVAVNEGFVGTQQEWLRSLVGQKGDKGDPGKDGIPGKDGAPGKDGQGALTADQATLLGTSSELQTESKTLPGAVNELKADNVRLGQEIGNTLFDVFPPKQFYIPVSNGDYISAGSAGAWASLSIYRAGAIIKSIPSVFLYGYSNNIAEYNGHIFYSTTNGNIITTLDISNNYNTVASKSMLGQLLKSNYGVVIGSSTNNTIGCYNVNLDVVSIIDFPNFSYMFASESEIFSVDTNTDVYRIIVSETSISKELLFNATTVGFTEKIINMIKGVYAWGAEYYVVGTKKNIQLLDNNYSKVGSDKISITGDIFGIVKYGDAFNAYAADGGTYNIKLGYGGSTSSISKAQLISTESSKLIYENKYLCMQSNILKSITYK